MNTLPASIQDFIAANFTDHDIRAAKEQAAQEVYDCLRADEYGGGFPDELATDVCQALLSDGKDMVIKLSMAVRDCINREDAAWGVPSDEASPDHAPDAEPALVPELADDQAARDLAVMNEASAIDQAVMDAEEAHRALGRIEGFEFLRRVGDVAIAQVFAEMRKSKKYKGLPYKDENGNLRHVEDFDEFCKAKLGKSYTRCYELSQNLHLLGPDLYESAEAIGFRNKDYRALKALPAEEQEAVKQAIASESKDEVLSILEDMAAKHQAEREAAKKEKDDMAADLEARERLLEDRGTRLEKTEAELYKLKSLPKDADLELKLAREEEAVERLHQEHITILAGIKPFFQVVSEILGDGNVSAHTKEYATWQVRQVCEAINQFLLDTSIPVDFSEIVYPEWAREQAQLDLREGNTEEPSGAHGSW